MGCVDSEVFEIDSIIKYLEKVAIIRNFYLVIGGGKVGTNFLEYAAKNKFPFVLVIDRDENAPASRRVKALTEESELENLLKNKAAESLPEEAPEFSPAKEQSHGGDHEPEAYFYKTDIHNVPSLFTFGIPEYIIPAVPCHTVAFMLADLLDFQKLEAMPKENLRNSSPVYELSIRPDDSGFMSFFKNIEAAFPVDIIAGSYPGEVCYFSLIRGKEKSAQTAAQGQGNVVRPLSVKSQKLLLNMPESCAIPLRDGFLKQF